MIRIEDLQAAVPKEQPQLPEHDFLLAVLLLAIRDVVAPAHWCGGNYARNCQRDAVRWFASRAEDPPELAGCLNYVWVCQQLSDDWEALSERLRGLLVNARDSGNADRLLRRVVNAASPRKQSNSVAMG